MALNPANSSLFGTAGVEVVKCFSSAGDVHVFVLVICRCFLSGVRRQWHNDAHQAGHVCSGITHPACSRF